MRRHSALTGLLVAGLVGLGAGCTGVPDGLEPVAGFEIDRYLGTWYEIARLDHRFERGLTDVSATYRLRSDGDIEVRNRGFEVGEERWKEAIGRAKPIGAPGTGSLKVSFFGPFYGGYHVIALDRDYASAMVSGPDRGYLWILAREKQISDERRTALVEQARASGFDVDALIWVEHDRSDPALEPERPRSADSSIEPSPKRFPDPALEPSPKR
jgi:apolipoprotein D and lipocalin family protein